LATLISFTGIGLFISLSGCSNNEIEIESQITPQKRFPTPTVETGIAEGDIPVFTTPEPVIQSTPTPTMTSTPFTHDLIDFRG
jgi:hypothetical protein